MGKTTDDLYRERLKRVEDAVRLAVPDRVPFLPRAGFFAAKYAGLSPEGAFYRSDKWLAANKKMIIELEPDMYRVSEYSGPALEAVDCRQMKWPGHGGPANSSYQYVEKEYMAAGEYDAFLDDPSDFLVRTYLPRIFGTLEPLRELPPLPTLFLHGYKGATSSAVFAAPEMTEPWHPSIRPASKPEGIGPSRPPWTVSLRAWVSPRAPPVRTCMPPLIPLPIC